jgi:hypothetical protein
MLRLRVLKGRKAMLRSFEACEPQPRPVYCRSCACIGVVTLTQFGRVLWIR